MEDMGEHIADGATSAPTEILAEFLSAVMTKDYKNALKYCQLILSYEPENSTVKEFYPLIIEKIKIIEKDGDEESISDSSESTSSLSSNTSDEVYEKTKSDSNRVTAGYSGLEDDCPSDGLRGFSELETDVRNGNSSSLTPREANQPMTDSHQETKMKSLGKSKKLGSKCPYQILKSSKTMSNARQFEKRSSERDRRSLKADRAPISKQSKSMTLNSKKENINFNSNVSFEKSADYGLSKTDRK